MVGAEYEQGGIIKHGAQMINAVSNSKVPHLSVIMGASYGAGNYGMNGRAYDPRFLFTWPLAKSAVMGPAQLAGVLSIVARAAAEARGQAYDEEGDAGMRAFVEQSRRGAEPAVLPVRDALRRRRHRPARHPDRAGDLPVGHRERPDPRRRGLRGVPDMIQRAPRRQPSGDRVARLPYLPPPRHRDRRRALRRRRGAAVRARGRRRRPAAGQRAGRHLPPHRPARRRRSARRRRRRASRLRLPLRERRLRPRRDRRRPDVGRARPGVDRGDGVEDRGQADHARGRRARARGARRADRGATCPCW